MLFRKFLRLLISAACLAALAGAVWFWLFQDKGSKVQEGTLIYEQSKDSIFESPENNRGPQKGDIFSGYCRYLLLRCIDSE